MAVVETRPRPTKVQRRSTTPGGKSARVWRWTVITGAALLLLVTVHMVAHHFVVKEVGGLRTYEQVLDYIATPLIFTIECFFLITVTAHALLGLRSVLFDLALGPKGRRRIDMGLWALGVVTVGYGFFLVGTLASRA
jgi:succinate dehydrogenase hydrophobic anchor subunit